MGVAAGAGEICSTSVDRDGTQSGSTHYADRGNFQSRNRPGSLPAAQNHPHISSKFSRRRGRTGVWQLRSFMMKRQSLLRRLQILAIARRRSSAAADLQRMHGQAFEWIALHHERSKLPNGRVRRAFLENFDEMCG